MFFSCFVLFFSVFVFLFFLFFSGFFLFFSVFFCFFSGLFLFFSGCFCCFFVWFTVFVSRIFLVLCFVFFLFFSGFLFLSDVFLVLYFVFFFFLILLPFPISCPFWFLNFRGTSVQRPGPKARIGGHAFVLEGLIDRSRFPEYQNLASVLSATVPTKMGIYILSRNPLSSFETVHIFTHSGPSGHLQESRNEVRMLPSRAQNLSKNCTCT